MKIRSTERGIALVITLIMLSIVTVMAVLFLGISRRERSAVTVTTDQITAKLMTESAFAHAQSRVVARMLTSSNALHYDMLVSTNFINVNGFEARRRFDPNNVSYVSRNGSHPDPYEQVLFGDASDRVLQNGNLLNERQQVVNIGNLYFDPRPPVYIQTNANPQAPLDFRFYLDFNRNGRFEPTGILREIDGMTGLPIGDLHTHWIGDPQWIGVLEYPNAPHSSSNRFIGRFAYLVLPEGKSLDLNTIHNQARNRNDSNSDFYTRNQGVGPWEINLAGFLADLNFNEWGNDGRRIGYNYQGYPLPDDPDRNSGFAFIDAASLLRHRGAPPAFHTMATLGNLGNLNALIANDFVDQFANGPFLTANSWLPSDDNDDANLHYWGGDLRNAYYDVQELFDTNKVSPSFVARLTNSVARLNGGSTYDRYTVYRLLSQLGVDSEVDDSIQTMSLALLDDGRAIEKVKKLNLNYNSLNASADLEWNPREFFIAAADRLLQANLNTNPPNFAATNVAGQRMAIAGTNFLMVGDTYVHRDFSVTNIQVWPPKVHGVHEYSANVHQLLQVSANIADVVTIKNRDRTNSNLQTFPLVFRPRFEFDPTNNVVRIFDFVEVTNNAFQRMRAPWRDLDIPADRNALAADDNVYGIPWVVAAKKGLPNFNEFGVLTSLDLTRKLEINKGRIGAPSNLWQTNQMMVLSISNLFGIELWNSYRQAYPRDLQIEAWVDCSMWITNQHAQPLLANQLSMTRPMNISANTWARQTNRFQVQFQNQIQNEFQLPIYTNYTPIARAALHHDISGTPIRFLPIRTNRQFNIESFYPDRGFPLGEIGMVMTNRVRCVIYDRQFNRIVDFVNLDNLVAGFSLTNEVFQPISVNGRQSESQQFWSMNRLGGMQNGLIPTEGVMSQIFASLGEIPVSDQLWRSYVGRGAGRDKEEAIDLFRSFLGFPPRFLSQRELADAFRRLRDPRKSWRRQVPFTPSVRKSIYQTWQANDPLVHYTIADLQDNEQLVSFSSFILPGQNVPAEDLHNLGTPNEPGSINQRYRPWPGDRDTFQRDDESSYNLAHKDPLIRQSDDWQFPNNKFPNIGWLGRVHRGTPWQTIYLKSYIGTDLAGRMLSICDLPSQNAFPNESIQPFQMHIAGDDENAFQSRDDLQIARMNWFRWAGSHGTHPTNDWKIFDHFTTALTENDSKGLLSVNQSGLAAWSAVLSGVSVQTNQSESLVFRRDLMGLQKAGFQPMTIAPAGAAGLPGADSNDSALAQIVNGTNGINATRAKFSGGRFRTLGDVLATPALSVQSPFLNWTNRTIHEAGLDDFAVERIPQQILSLLKPDEPRLTIYAYGQSLRPAEGSLYTGTELGGRLFNLCTNYQITGEFVAKRVLRLDASRRDLDAVVENEIVIAID